MIRSTYTQKSFSSIRLLFVYGRSWLVVVNERSKFLDFRAGIRILRPDSQIFAVTLKSHHALAPHCGSPSSVGILPCGSRSWWVGALGYFSRGLRLRKRRPGGTFTVGGAPAPRVTAQGIRTNYIMGPRKRFIEFCYDTCLRFSVCTHFGNPAARAAATGNNDTRLSLGSSSPVRQIRERHLT